MESLLLFLPSSRSPSSSWLLSLSSWLLSLAPRSHSFAGQLAGLLLCDLRRLLGRPFGNDGERFDRGIGHWSILLSRSSRWSNRLCQKPAIWLVPSISGAKGPDSALSGG